jgi:ketosteroid isomerase-like protein
MKRWLHVIGLLLTASPAIADDVQDVRCHEIAFSQSVENQDADAFATFLHADARFISGSLQRGADEIIKAWSVFFGEDAPKMKWRPQYTEVLNDGTLALSRGPFHMTAVGENGETIHYWGTFNSVWRKQSDNTWKIIFDAGNNAAEPPSEDVQAILDKEVDCS